MGTREGVFGGDELCQLQLLIFPLAIVPNRKES